MYGARTLYCSHFTEKQVKLRISHLSLRGGRHINTSETFTPFIICAAQDKLCKDFSPVNEFVNNKKSKFFGRSINIFTGMKSPMSITFRSNIF